MPRKKIKKLNPGEKRYLRYINNHGITVEIPEDLAGFFHCQMKEFLGDQHGDKTLPKNIVRQGEQGKHSTWLIGLNSQEMSKEEFLKEIEKKKDV